MIPEKYRAVFYLSGFLLIDGIIEVKSIKFRLDRCLTVGRGFCQFCELMIGWCETLILTDRWNAVWSFLRSICFSNDQKYNFFVGRNMFKCTMHMYQQILGCLAVMVNDKDRSWYDESLMMVTVVEDNNVGLIWYIVDDMTNMPITRRLAAKFCFDWRCIWKTQRSAT